MYKRTQKIIQRKVKKVVLVVFMVCIAAIGIMQPIQANENTQLDAIVGKRISEIFADDELGKEIAYMLSGQYDVDYVITEANVQGLKYVKITNKDIQSLKGLENFPNITTLVLFATNLQEFPKEVLKLTKLERLELNSNLNMSGAVPSEIQNLTSLTRIELNKTSISSIPESITELQNLNRINITGTFIQEMPGDYSKLINLDTLYASNAKLTSLPKGLTTLQKLKTVTFVGNHLTNVSLDEYTYITSINAKGLASQSNISVDDAMIKQGEAYEISGLPVYRTFAQLHHNNNHVIKVHHATYVEEDTHQSIMNKATDVSQDGYVNQGEIFIPKELNQEVGKYIVVISVEGGGFQKSLYYHYYDVVAKPSKVIVSYVDEQDNEIIQPIEIEGLLGDTYQLERKEFDGYRYKEVIGNESGEFVEKTTSVTYVYEKIRYYNVTYTDGVEGGMIFEDVIYSVEEGMDTPVYEEMIDREGYTFKGWYPIVEKTVTRDIVYVAQWEKNIEVSKPDPTIPNNEKPSIVPSDQQNKQVVTNQPSTGVNLNETMANLYVMASLALCCTVILTYKKIKNTKSRL